ncbi:MAG: RluA family pseudouridine synthase [Rickettsiales bacterium]
MIVNKLVENDSDNIRLDRWFKRNYPSLNHSSLEKMLRKGEIRLDGNKVKSSTRISGGQNISYPEFIDKLPPTTRQSSISKDDIKFINSLVLYKDNNLIIINKPSGLATQGGSKIRKNVDGLLDGLKSGNEIRPKLVHRLDKDTSGILALALNSQSANYLTKMFADKKIEKTYVALVNNRPKQAKGTIDYSLIKTGNSTGSYEKIEVDEEDGKYAITEYLVLDSIGKEYALVELKPLTGRTHQLRVHMQAIGCPIVGDGKYGGINGNENNIGIENGLHLHARRIVIPAFLGGKKIDITAPFPEHMQKSFKNLGIN